MTSAASKVLVIGGGFSGMSAAIELRKRGVEVDLVEIDPGWRSYGAGISIGGPTLRALKTLGVLDEFMRQGAVFDGVELYRPHGAFVGTLPTPELACSDISGHGAIMRPALAKILADATLAAGTTVHLGCTFTSIAQDADGVAVTFSDGRSERYDLVIGADGLYSKVREAVFPQAPKPRYTGQGVWRAVLPRPAEVQRTMIWVGPKLKAGLNPVSATHMYAFVTEDRENHEHIPAEHQPAMLRALLASFSAPLMQQLSAQVDESAQVIYRPLESLLMPQPWFAGQVLLIGDAAHATTPHLASGACIGIEDAIVLAEELEHASTAAQAVERFQVRRWERCRMVVENSGRLGEIEIAGGDKQEHARIMRESFVALAEPI